MVLDLVSSICSCKPSTQHYYPAPLRPCTSACLSPSPLTSHHPGRWVGDEAKNTWSISNSPLASSNFLFLKHTLLFCKRDLPYWHHSALSHEELSL